MVGSRTGQIAVIFTTTRTKDDDAGYSNAAAEMEVLASAQPGYLGISSVRHPNREGITVSYWADEESARAWHGHPDHARIRDLGRGKWYEHYELHVAAIGRSYSWKRDD